MSTSCNEVSIVKKTIGEDRFDKLINQLKNEHTCLAHAANIPLTELENLHRLGQKYLLRHEYEQAERLMNMLVHLYPYAAVFWGTYGAVLQCQKHYSQARSAYAVASELDSQCPDWYVYAAECELMMQQPKFALDLIRPVFHMSFLSSGQRVEVLRRAQRIKTLAENTDFDPSTLLNTESDMQERLAQAIA